MLLKNCNAFIDNEFINTDILIENEKIVKIAPNINYCGEVIDVKGRLVSAGFVDIHQHLREPGYSHKETIKTGSLANAKGGITTACAMPNLKPVPDSLENLNQELELIKKDSCMKVLPYGAITLEEKGQSLVNFSELAPFVFAFSDDGRGVANAKIMKDAMIECAKLNKYVVAHCEDLDLVEGGFMHDGLQAKKLGIKGISSSSESVQVARDMLLCKETNSNYHVCHISAKESVKMVELGKSLGVNISCEVTPHHLISCDEDIKEDNGMWKMNPPLRSKDDKDYLIKALNEGIIEVIATDHAPHSKDEKQGGFSKAYFGIIGSEFAFSLLYTKLVKSNLVSLKTILNAFSTNPKKIFNLENAGELKTGSRADIVVIDLEKTWELKESEIISLGKNTPYLGEVLSSKVMLTICDGKIIYKGE